jgi:hypothetical protein
MLCRSGCWFYGEVADLQSPHTQLHSDFSRVTGGTVGSRLGLASLALMVSSAYVIVSRVSYVPPI